MEKSAGMYTVLNMVCVNQQMKKSLTIPMCGHGGKGGQSVCLMTGKQGVAKAEVAATEMSNFFKIKSLGTIVKPRCGSCRCGKCPVPGFHYSPRE